MNSAVAIAVLARPGRNILGGRETTIAINFGKVALHFAQRRIELDTSGRREGEDGVPQAGLICDKHERKGGEARAGQCGGRAQCNGPREIGAFLNRSSISVLLK